MSNKNKKTNSWDIEKGTIVIVEPMKRIPADSISALEKDIIRSMMPITQSQAAKYFEYGNPLERELKGMHNEDLESYAIELNDSNKFNLARGTKRYRKRHKRSRKHKQSRKHRRSRKHKRR